MFSDIHNSSLYVIEIHIYAIMNVHFSLVQVQIHIYATINVNFSEVQDLKVNELQSKYENTVRSCCMQNNTAVGWSEMLQSFLGHKSIYVFFDESEWWLH